MGFIILAIFIGIPIMEIAVFIEVGERIGLGWTIATVIATAVAGTILLRYQGFATLARAQQQVAEGRPPVLELLEGVGLLIAACLLLTPGFVTDAVGALLLITPVRRYIATTLIQKILASGQFAFHRGGPGRTNARGSESGVIDGDFEDVTGETVDPANLDPKKLP